MKLLKSAGGAVGLLGLVFAVAKWPRAKQSPTAEVAWTVRVPLDTPDNAPLYLCGNLPELGSWSAQGFEMRRVQAHVYTAKLQLRLHKKLEYKFTRGSWLTVEVEPDGSPRSNRRLEVVHSEKVLANIEAWSDRVVPKK